MTLEAIKALMATLSPEDRAQLEAEIAPQRQKAPFTMNGALFADTSEKRIDHSGKLTLKQADLAAFLQWLDSIPADSPDDLTLYLIGWNRKDTQGNAYISFKAEPGQKKAAEADHQ